MLSHRQTITHDTLGWYGWDADGGGIHDVIGSRCDPYTQAVLVGTDYSKYSHTSDPHHTANSY